MNYRVAVPVSLSSSRSHSHSHPHPQAPQFVYSAPGRGMGHTSWLPTEYVVPAPTPAAPHPRSSWDFVSSQHDMHQLTPLEHMYRTQVPPGATHQAHPPHLDSGKESDTKRIARNVREQRRTHRLTEQIDTIKTLLDEAQVPLKSNSKYHILYACEEYIAQLQTKQDSLVAEKRELQAPVQSVMKTEDSGEKANGNQVVQNISKRSNKRRREKAGSSNMPVVWKDVFLTARTPLAIAKPDGQIIAWNKNFEHACGFTEHDLGRLTIFSLVHPTDLQKMFVAVAECLQELRHHNTPRSMRVYTRNCRSPMNSTDSGERPEGSVTETWDITVTPVRDQNTADPHAVRWLACALTECLSSSSTSEESSNDNQSQSDNCDQSSNSPQQFYGCAQTNEGQASMECLMST